MIAEVERLLRALVAIEGVTSGAGDVNTIVDAARVEGVRYWHGRKIVMLAGAARGQVTNIVADDGAGNLTIWPALNAAPGAFQPYLILNQYADAVIAAYGIVADAVGPAITDFDTNLTEVTANHYNGQLLLFVTGPNAGQSHTIDVYSGVNGNVAFAASDQWTDIPVNGNAFIIIPDVGAYLKKIFTLLAVTDGKVDAIETKLDAGGLGSGKVTKALTFANQVGQVPLFTVTGDVIVRIIAVVKTNCGTTIACNVSVGIAADVDAIIPVTDITLLAAQEIWFDATPDSEIEALGTMREHIISDGNDITLSSSAADNSGAITFYCFWTALSAGASVVAA